MTNRQAGFNKFVVWGGAAVVILVGFVVLPALVWVLPFRWLSHWPRWALVPLCVLGTVGYFRTAWAALQRLARGAGTEEPSLTWVPPNEGPPGGVSDQARAQRSAQTMRVYEEILAEDTDPDIRQAVEEALTEQEGRLQPAGAEDPDS